MRTQYVTPEEYAQAALRIAEKTVAVTMRMTALTEGDFYENFGYQICAWFCKNG